MMLAELQRWVDRGWLRRLDVAFARFLATFDAPEPLLLAAALVARLEGRGHACLPLHELDAGEGLLFGLEPAALAAVRACWQASVVATPAWQQHAVLTADSAPLVLQQGRLYLRRLWLCEQSIRNSVAERVAAQFQFTSEQQHCADEWLVRLFPMANVAGATGATEPVTAAGPDWQREACAVALRSRFTIITGGPGTGKTYTAARLYALLQALQGVPDATGNIAPPLRVVLAAPTGKAAGRLQQSIALALEGLSAALGEQLPAAARAAAVPKAQTLHRLLGARPDTRAFARHAGRPIDCDVVIVDEASMVDLEMMAALLAAVPPAARIVLLGDRDQLASVEAGAVLADLCAAPAASPLGSRIVALQRSHRFAGPIGALAMAINAGASEAVGQALQGTAIVAEVPATPARLAALTAGYGVYAALLAKRPAATAGEGAFQEWVRQLLATFDGFRVLCAVREGPWGVTGVNAAVEQALHANGAIAPQQEWYEGRPVMVTRNDAALGVANGDIGLVLRSPEGSLRAWFADGGQVRSVGVSRLSEVQTAFALTVHKSQGSEFGHVVVSLGAEAHAGLTRELLYTAITRARERVTLVAGSWGVVQAAVARRTQRAGGLQFD